MFFVDRGPAPDALAEIEKEEREKWLAYFQGRRKSLPNGRWTENAVRDILIAAFQENCGYCGRHTTVAKAGEVDHFKPKCLDKQNKQLVLTYRWTNYVWSCHACNKRKLDFYEEQAHILDPCCQKDTASLVWNDRGGYRLREKYKNDPRWLKRFENTGEKTLINDPAIMHDRKFLYDQIETFCLQMKHDAKFAKTSPKNSARFEKTLEQLRALTKNHFKLLTKYCLEQDPKTPVTAEDLGIGNP